MVLTQLNHGNIQTYHICEKIMKYLSYGRASGKRFEQGVFRTQLPTTSGKKYRARSLCNRIADFNEQNISSKAKNSSASQDIPSILLNPKAQYRLHKDLPLYPNLSNSRSIRILPTNLFNV
jgi:hypothetical protein